MLRRRRIFAFLSALLLLTALCACAVSESSPYTVTRYGTDYIVDPQNNTISDGVNTYRYLFSGNSSEYNLEIRYPDDSTWFQHIRSSGNFASGSSGWSDDYDKNRYVAGEVLRDLLKKEIPRRAPIKVTPIVILLLAAGALNLAFPYAAWYLAHGWRYKNSEPSDLALILNRAAGIIAIIIAMVLIFV